MKRWITLSLLATLAACGGKAESYEYHWFSNGAVPSGGLSSAAGASGSAAVGGANSAGSPGAAGGGTTGSAGESGFAGIAGAAGNVEDAGGSGGNAGSAGVAGGAGMAGSAGIAGSVGSAGSAGMAGGSAGTAGGSARACETPLDCPLPPNACIAPRCTAGVCSTVNLSAGPHFIVDAPADCHATIACDGNGGATLAVDQSNTPTSVNPCLASTCNSKGMPGTEPLPARTRCPSIPGGLCDGVDKCVQCLKNIDCPNGESCAFPSHVCVSAPCTDGDCGGVCAPCALTQKCLIDRDCSSGACDALSLTCVADRCADHRRDGNETDVDCGGGSGCPPCPIGHTCYVDYDCATQACDYMSLTCVQDPCTDHRLDGLETDTDCGGANNCSRCAIGKNCRADSDCAAGHTCTQWRQCQ